MKLLAPDKAAGPPHWPAARQTNSKGGQTQPPHPEIQGKAGEQACWPGAGGIGKEWGPSALGTHEWTQVSSLPGPQHLVCNEARTESWPGARGRASHRATHCPGPGALCTEQGLQARMNGRKPSHLPLLRGKALPQTASLCGRAIGSHGRKAGDKTSQVSISGGLPPEAGAAPRPFPVTRAPTFGFGGPRKCLTMSQ